MYSKLELVTVYAVVASKSVKNRFCEKNIQICSMVWITWAASHSYPIFLGMFPEEWPRKILPTFSSREVTLGEMRKIGIHFITYPWNRTKKNQSPQTSVLDSAVFHVGTPRNRKLSRFLPMKYARDEHGSELDQDWSQLRPDQDWIGLQFFWKLEDQDWIGLKKFVVLMWLF